MKACSTPNENEIITITVKMENYADMRVKLKRNQPILKLIQAVCERRGLSHTELRFLHDGARLAATSTAISAGIEDNDEIEVEKETQGGSI